jgi:hypothetical protein
LFFSMLPPRARANKTVQLLRCCIARMSGSSAVGSLTRGTGCVRPGPCVSDPTGEGSMIGGFQLLIHSVYWFRSLALAFGDSILEL